MSGFEELVGAANAAVAARKWDEAEQLWGEVYKLDPKHTRALYGLAAHALQRGDLQSARSRLEEARAVSPDDLAVLQLAMVVLQRLGDAEAELDAIDNALRVEPYFLHALLSKGSWLERHGSGLAAASMYRNALTVAGPEMNWPAASRTMLEHARQVAEGHAANFHAYLSERLGPRIPDLAPSARGRWDEANAIMSGRTAAYPSVSNQLSVPRLPAIPFFDRKDFGWVEALEAQTSAIRAELEGALESRKDAFAPYITYGAGEPVNQWKDLNHSKKWSHLSLWRSSVGDDDNQAACPVTTSALNAVDMADIEGLCPNAMFSALAPHTEIPPHHGETNARLVVHLPLIVPEKCTYRVGFEQREWNAGEVLIFDDTIEHTARNDSDELRVVLIFDVWNPLLAVEERALVREMAAAARAYGSQS